jgi:hypothetical protein
MQRAHVFANEIQRHGNGNIVLQLVYNAGQNPFPVFYCSRRYLLLLIPVLLPVSEVETRGQAIQSTILGRVTDPSGAAVAGAAVTIKNEGTNIERTMGTDENGDYRIAGLGSEIIRSV